MNIIKVLVNQQQQSYLYQMKQTSYKLKIWVNYINGLYPLHHFSICSLTFQFVNLVSNISMSCQFGLWLSAVISWMKDRDQIPINYPKIYSEIYSAHIVKTYKSLCIFFFFSFFLFPPCLRENLGLFVFSFSFSPWPARTTSHKFWNKT